MNDAKAVSISVVQHLIRQQLLQPSVLLLKRSQTPSIRRLQAPELRFVLVERRRAGPMLSAHIRSRHPWLLLLQDRNDLLASMKLAKFAKALSNLNPIEFARF